MGVHRGILQAFKHMKNGGLVVNVSSTAGLTCIGDMMATPAYVTSKHAVTSLTRTFGVRGHPQIRGREVVGLQNVGKFLQKFFENQRLFQ